jgi:hypothetical protein
MLRGFHKMKYLIAEAEALIDKIRKYDPILADFYSENLKENYPFKEVVTFLLTFKEI